MFLSPILILALLFSSCDDGEKAPDNTVTVKVSGESIAKESFTGTDAIASDESFTVTTTPDGIEATDVSIKVTLSGENYTVEGSFNVPKGKEPTDKTELKWESLANVFTDTKKVTVLTLKGSYKDGTFTVTEGSYTATDIPKGTVTIPYDKIGQDLKTAAADATATVNWGTDGEAFNGSGEWTDLESGDITLSDVPTNTQSIYVKVVLTGSSAGTYKSDAISIDFAGDTTAEVKEEVNFTKEEPVTVSLSQTEVPVTGEGGGKEAVEALTTGTITLTTANLSETAKQTVESVESLTITFTEAGKASPAGTLKLASGKESIGESVEFTNSITAELSGIQSISKVVLKGSGTGSEWKVSGITIEAEAAVSP